MNNLLAKIIFYFRKPKIIIVTGNGRASATEAIYQVLKQNFKVRKISEIDLPLVEQNEILIFETEVKNYKLFEFIVKNSKLSILVVTHFGEIPQDIFSFAGEKKEVDRISNLVKTLPPSSSLVLNFDDETIREIKSLTNLKTLTFGFQERADFQATDIKLNLGTNFKLNYQGNIVPIWLAPTPIKYHASPELNEIWTSSGVGVGKEDVYAALAATCVGIIFNLNLVEISQAFKLYKGFPGIDRT